MPAVPAPRLTALVAFTALVGCAGGGATSAPDQALAPALRAELDGPAIAVLSETVRAVEAHDWDAYRAVLSPEDFGEAVGFLVGGGQDRTAAISVTMEGVLSLGWQTTRIFPADLDRAQVPTAGLDRIRSLRFDALVDRSPEFDRVIVEGTVTLDDGTIFPVSVTVLRPAGPDPVLAVPQG